MLALMVLCTLPLAACAAGRTPDDPCGALPLQPLVGGPVTAFDRSAAPGPVRVYRRGDAITMDHNPARLNVETDARGIILTIRCG